MSPAEILKALGDGGFAVILFAIIALLWRELVMRDSRHDIQMTDLRDQQMRNVSKIARLEAQIELLISLRGDYRKHDDETEAHEHKPALKQPAPKSIINS